MSVISKKVQSPVAKTEEAVKPQITMEALLSRIEKLEEGGYDKADKTTDLPTNTTPQEGGYQVPGVKNTEEEENDNGMEDAPEKKDGYGRGYVEPKSKSKDKGDGSEDDGDDDEMEEKTCESCGSKYQSKKEDKKKDEEEEEVLPKKEAQSLDFGKWNNLFTPTKEELTQAKGIKVDRQALFGIPKKENNSPGHKMNMLATQLIGFGGISKPIVK